MMPLRLHSFFLYPLLGAALLSRCAQGQAPSMPAVPPVVAAGQPLPWLDSLLTASPLLARHQVGFSLAYADSTRPFYGYHESQYFVPASMMKVFSLYTGLHLLPDSLPSLRYFSRHDTLFFQGTGDPTFLHGDVPSRRAYTFLQSRPEKMLAYTDIATVPAYGPGWSWDDFGYYFQAERGPFPIFGNTVRFYAAAPVVVRPRPGVRAPATLLPQRVRVLPHAFASLTEVATTPLSPDQDPTTHVRRAPQENRFYTYQSSKKWIDEVPFRTSRGLLLRLLGDTLRRPIVGVLWRPRPSDSVRVLRGLPVDSLYRRMLRVSDNFLAEQLLLMSSTTLGHDSLSTRRAIRYALRTHFKFLPDYPTWVDGSGLSRLNLVTPRDFTTLLLKLHQEVPEARLLSLLAAGGGQGTLRKRYHDATGPWFWGKTGTLTNNVNLCGYVRTKSGRLLAVSFFNNNAPGDDYPLRNEIERVLREVRMRL